jgi:hypothetical protein
LIALATFANTSFLIPAASHVFLPVSFLDWPALLFRGWKYSHRSVQIHSKLRGFRHGYNFLGFTGSWMTASSRIKLRSVGITYKKSFAPSDNCGSHCFFSHGTMAWQSFPGHRNPFRFPSQGLDRARPGSIQKWCPHSGHLT